MSGTARKTCIALWMAIGVLYTAQANAGEITCRDAQSWVKAHREALPDNLDDFAALPQSLRPAVLGALSPDVKSQLWASHVERYAAAHPELTGEQRVVLDRLLRVARDSQTFSRNPTEPRWLAAMNRLEQQVRAALGADAAEAVLTRLGEVGVSPDHQILVSFNLPELSGDPDSDSDSDADVPVCTCSTSSDYCGSGHYCKAVRCAQSGGCGFLGLYTCNGICYVKITVPADTDTPTGTDVTP